jgi:LacI family transcriptional regulator, galactose operon repressor
MLSPRRKHSSPVKLRPSSPDLRMDSKAPTGYISRSVGQEKGSSLNPPINGVRTEAVPGRQRLDRATSSWQRTQHPQGTHASDSERGFRRMSDNHLNRPDAGTGNAQPTLQHIAEESGLSVTTISRVLSGQAARYRISKKTETAVRKLAKEFGFVPNQLARGLRLRKSLTIGLVIPDISNPFFAGIAHQVILGTRLQGYSVILCDSQDDTDLEVQSLALLQSRSVEGVVLCPVGQSGAHLAEFVGGRLPIVLVDRFFPDLPLPYVSSDNVTGARQATELLIASGYRQVACLQGAHGTSPNESRIRGYKDALAQHHLPIDEDLIVGDSFSEQSGYIETKLLLKRQPAVRAILALSNLNALGALRALTEEKRRIPDDVSIVSFDDTPYSAFLATPLTTVAQANSEMGEVAIKLLFDQIQSPHRQTKGGILLPTTLVMRSSVKRFEPPSN